MGRQFRVGAATTDLTPDRALANYNGQWLEPVGHGCPLRCHALVFSCGGRQGALVAGDATFIDRALVLRLREESARATGIHPGRILVAATHTHGAPATCPSFLSGALPDPLYLDFFAGRVVKAMVQAQRRLQPALLVSGTAAAPGWEFNRRLLRPDGSVVMAWSPTADPAFPPAGPVDRDLPFLAFETPSGEPIAFVANYACHNNCTSGAYHGDLGGRMAQAVGQELGGQCPTLFLQAPCADVMWRGARKPALAGDGLACRIGADLAARLVPAYRREARRSVEGVRFAQRVMEIADRPWEESTFCRDLCRGDGDEARAFARRRYDPEEAAVKARGATSCAVEIQGIAFGDAAVCANPAELFTAFGLDIRRRSPFRTTLIAELANGYCGYVPVEEAFDQQGYETHRTVYTSRLEKAAGLRIAAASADMLQELRPEC